MLCLHCAMQSEVLMFYRHLLHNCGAFLCDVFLMFFLDIFKSDCILQTSFLSKSDAVKSVWQACENYCMLL